MTAELPAEAIEAAARAIWSRHWPGLDYDAESTIVEQSRCRRDATAALTAAAPIIEARAKAEALRDLERTLFDIEGKHHFHNVRCLCGFESHRSRSRTEHITGLVRAATLEGESE